MSTINSFIYIQLKWRYFVLKICDKISIFFNILTILVKFDNFIKQKVGEREIVKEDKHLTLKAPSPGEAGFKELVSNAIL